jgi:hypothetical protein
VLGLALFDTGADGAVDWFGFVLFGIDDLFVDGVDKRIIAVLADEDLVRHSLFFVNITAVIDGFNDYTVEVLIYGVDNAERPSPKTSNTF